MTGPSTSKQPPPRRAALVYLTILQCKIHRRYRGTKRPINGCGRCCWIYLQNQKRLDGRRLP